MFSMERSHLLLCVVRIRHRHQQVASRMPGALEEKPVRFSGSSIQFSSKRPQPGVWGLNRRAPNRLPANVPISRGFQLNRSLVSVDTSRMALHAEDCKRRAHLFKAQLQRLRLAAGDQSHNCRNLDRDLLVEYVDRLRLRAPKAYSGLAGPA